MFGAHVFVHQSQFPNQVRDDLMTSLRSRRMDHKFHYESYKQAEKWRALHRAFSPAKNDPSCQSAYDEAFRAAAHEAGDRLVHVAGLGCGGGEKEARLLQLLSRGNRELSYTPCDVSLPLVLTAWTAVEAIPDLQCYPLVCDLGVATDLTETMETQPVIAESRIVTLFGVLPNFEVRALLANVVPLLRREDLLLLSTNLAPGNDYEAGVSAVLPQYDNDLTRDWLLTLLWDLGMEPGDGEISFEIETDADAIKRITAHFQFARARTLHVHDEEFAFAAGERLRLFFSSRHTADTIQAILRPHGMRVDLQWTNQSGEEGVFLCRKT